MRDSEPTAASLTGLDLHAHGSGDRFTSGDLVTLEWTTVTELVSFL